MGKKKPSNPLDAHRKAQRQRELKKNRERRHRAQESSLIQQDTLQLEQEIKALQSDKSGDAVGALVADRKAELARIRAAKDAYLLENPEHRKLVYPNEEAQKAEQDRQRSEQTRVQQAKQPDPRRSVYYHETFNPLGAPPPGLPYMEKSQQQWDAEQRAEYEARMEASSRRQDGEDDVEDNSDDSEDDDESEGEVTLPQGPPPVQTNDGNDTDSSEDSDGVVMPVGPPPERPPTAPRAMAVTQTDNAAGVMPPLPPGPTPPWAYVHVQRPPMPTYYQVPPPPHSAALIPGSLPPNPMHPQQSWQPHQPQFAGQVGPMPRPPPFHRPLPSASSDTIGPMPANRPLEPPGPAPPRPAAVISAAPVLRDLKKEATTFVPTALRKKQAAGRARAAKGGLPNAVNAAPNADEDQETRRDKIDLMDSLRPHLDQQRSSAASSTTRPAEDDYKKFLSDIGELL